MNPFQQGPSTPWQSENLVSLRTYDIEHPQLSSRSPEESNQVIAIRLPQSRGFDPRQIRELGNPNIREAVHHIADMHEDDVDRISIWSDPSQRQPNSLPSSSGMDSSSQHVTPYPSDASNYISDQVSVATNYGLHGPESFNSPLAYVPGTSLLQTSSAWAMPNPAGLWLQCGAEYDASTSLVPESGFPGQKFDLSGQGATSQSAIQIGFAPRNKAISEDPTSSLGIFNQHKSILKGELPFHHKVPQSRSRSARVRDRQRPQSQTITFPCSEPKCPKFYVSTAEFSKHLTGDHEKDATFSCSHAGCTVEETTREDIQKRHHTNKHSECETPEQCIRETRSRQKRCWGCGLCVQPCADPRIYAEHYKTHFGIDKKQKEDIDLFTVLRSLLSQDSIKDEWDKRSTEIHSAEGKCHLTWESENFLEIREALEYGTFKSHKISQPGVLDGLLDEVSKMAAGRKPKRSAPASPELRPLRATKTGRSSETGIVYEV